jgi:ankyrin repeat protein
MSAMTDFFFPLKRRGKKLLTILYRAEGRKSQEFEILPKIRKLLKKRTDLNYGEYNALDKTLEMDWYETAKLLIENGANLNTKQPLMPYLHRASEKGDRTVEIVKLLIKKGVDVNEKQYDKTSALHIAAQKGAIEIAKSLIEKGADIKARIYDGKSALHFAAQKGAIEIVKLLIKKGVDVNEKTIHGETALHFASGEKGAIETVKLLIEKGLNVNEKTIFGITPLHNASYCGDAEIAEILIKHGVDLDAKASVNVYWYYDDGDGVYYIAQEASALHIATISGHIEITKLLIQNRADLDIKDSRGNTALDLASLSLRGDPQIAQVLKRAEAKDR